MTMKYQKGKLYKVKFYQDMVGTVDARMILEPLEEDRNHEE